MQSRSHAGRGDTATEVEDEDESEASTLEGGGEDGEETEINESSSESSSETIEVWRDNRRNIVPLFYFTTSAIESKDHKLRQVGRKYGMSFRMVNECKIVRQICVGHGFTESYPGDFDFNLMWTGKHLKAEVIRSFYKHQRINHFPRTYELTRKDRLYKNVQKMQEAKGFRNFDFVPTTFVMPQEFASFSSYFCREGGVWIVKPVASSRGRGIFLVSHPEQVPTDEPFVVSRYISNPLLIDGYKFDIRLYVLVTSFDPLVIYLYEEGLARFATVKFDKSTRHIGNHFMHLTNYSVNKRSLSFVQNSNPDVEDQGFKWTLGALLRRLRSMGKDTVTLMMKVEDAIVKTIISGETQISAACRMYVPYKENCFEVFGFDVIIDENLKPFVLEVNLSPSLACDSPLDLKVKSHMICDMLNLVGLPCSNEILNQKTGKSTSTSNINNGSKHMNSAGIAHRPHSGVKSLRSSRIRPSSAAVSAGGSSSSAPLSVEERQSIRRIREETQRAGGFIRLFPTEDSWDLYGSYFDSHASFNATVIDHLYDDRASMTVKSKAEAMSNFSLLILRQNMFQQQSTAIAAAISCLQRAASVSGTGSAALAYQRASRYERSLPQGGQRIRPPGKMRPQNHGSGGASANQRLGRPSTASATVTKSVSHSVSNQNLTETTRPNMAIVIPQYKPKIAVDDPEMFHLQVANSSNAKAQLRSEEKATKPVSPRVPAATAVTSTPIPAVASNSSSNQPNQSAPALPNLIADIENGYSLSVTQARSAFTRYLELVRTRLLTPISASASSEIQEAETQNLDLVVRFMRRAAVNLSEAVKITPPSKRLGLEDQRTFVANQMTEFLSVYKKDTFLLPNDDVQIHSARSQHSTSSNFALTVDPVKLNEYLSLVNEAELEKFLTHYTKVKKSASIFLGSPLSNSAAVAKNNRPAATLTVTGHGSSNGIRPATSISETAHNNYSNYTTHVWTTVNNNHHANQQAENEDEVVSHSDTTLPEGIVLRSDGQRRGSGHVNHRPPPIPNSGRSSASHRPMSSASISIQQAPNNGSGNNSRSSLAQAVAVYSAPVRPAQLANTSVTKPALNHNNNVAITKATAENDNPALATSAYLRWSSGVKGSLANSSSDAILSAALQRIALKYSGSSGKYSNNQDARRLSHSGSLNSLAAANNSGNGHGTNGPAVQFTVVTDNSSINSRTGSVAHANNSNQQPGQQIKTRPQSASLSSSAGSSRPPLPEGQHQKSRRSKPLVFD